MKEPLGSIENAQQYLGDLWARAKWPAEQRRVYSACGEVAVMLLAEVDRNRVYEAQYHKMYNMAYDMMALNLELASEFLQQPLPLYGGQSGAAEVTGPGAELILQNASSLEYEILEDGLRNHIRELALSARVKRQSVLAHIAAYTSLVTKLDMPTGNMLAALSVVHGIEDLTTDDHEDRFHNWKTAKADAWDTAKEIGLPSPMAQPNREDKPDQ